MQTSPDRIRDREFTRTRRGFDVKEVTAFLDKIAHEVAQLEVDLRRETVRANTLERRAHTPRQAEENVEAAFLAAAESKRHLLAEAQDRADQLVSEASAEAARLVDPTAQVQIGHDLIQVAG